MNKPLLQFFCAFLKVNCGHDLTQRKVIQDRSNVQLINNNDKQLTTVSMSNRSKI